AWIEVMGETLKGYAKAIRDAVDEFDPTVRVGLCGVAATCDHDGVDCLTLAKILAGNTKPLLRLNGAPYWTSIHQHEKLKMHDIIDFERRLAAFCKDSGAELMNEEDTYPRPRHLCSSAKVEGFETLLRAEGSADGVLKYAFDYYATTDYERGYVDATEKNLPVYEKIERAFCGKIAVGIYNPPVMERNRTATLPDEFFDPQYWQGEGSNFISAQGLPMSFTRSDAPVVLESEYARNVDLKILSNGGILDLTAAKILTERGVDVGLAGTGKSYPVTMEYFPDEDQYVGIFGGNFEEVTLKAGAKVLSETVYEQFGEYTRRPAVYSYKNADGQAFYVLCASVRYKGYARQDCSIGLVESYCRQRQLIKWC
ncbi:MAG: hypothetical protein MJ072_05885, partial [Clostridia bacterium]|nr:hypothetical protein [Clostridia bacterium]